MSKRKFNFNISPGSSIKNPEIEHDTVPDDTYVTVLELSKELKISKSTIFRYLKNNSIEALRCNGMIYLDDTVQQRIKSHFLQIDTVSCNTYDAVHDTVEPRHDTVKNTLNDTDLITILKQNQELLKNQLEEKDKQIAELQKLLGQQQQLNLIAQDKKILLEEKPKSFFSKFLSKE